jgi:tetratricopeptide (TPR) repeat protein
MPFQPNVHDQLTIDGVTYRIAEHPAAPRIPYGQEGRAGIVYCLEPSPSPAGWERGPGGEGSKAALKVFKPRFRSPFLVAQADRMAPFAALPGLRACRRTVLTPSRHADLLRQYPDLTYAVLMPWIEGPTWFDVLMDRKPLPPETSLALARSLAGVLMRMEEQGIAHCDLSAPNVMLPLLAGGTGVELVDLEGLYAPGMTRPQELSSGSAGYAHRQATGGLWGPEADRFAGAVLLAEMLGWCDPQVVQAAWEESYFAPAEMQQETPHYRTLVAALERHWGSSVARLLERAWHSDSLLDCPTFGEWMVVLPEKLLVEETRKRKKERKKGDSQDTEREARETLGPSVRALMEAARRLEEQGKLDGALEVYRQALEVARSDPSLHSLAWEIELTIQDVQRRYEAEEAQRRAEESAKRKAKKKEGAQRRAEEPAKRKAKKKEGAQRRAEEQAKRKAEEEAQRRAEEQTKQKAEEARRTAEEQARREWEGHVQRAEEEHRREVNENIGCRVGFLWVLTNTLGWLAAGALADAISGTIEGTPGRIVGGLVAGALVGAVVGLAQAPAFFNDIFRGWWILINALGWTIGCIASQIIHYTDTSFTLCGVWLVGLLIGLIQWLVLSTRTREGLEWAFWWILVNIISWAGLVTLSIDTQMRLIVGAVAHSLIGVALMASWSQHS